MSTEYGEAVKFYAERRVELAQAFINAVEDAILYTIEEDYVLILAVMHCSREPGYWKERVKDKPSGEKTEL
jgi:toxin ParE1/3/4